MAKTYRKLPSKLGTAMPEGPYEAGCRTPARPSGDVELARIADFLDNLVGAARAQLPLSDGLREIGIVLELVRNHSLGRLTTLSSLAAASKLSYGTAFRAIEELIAVGAIVKRPKTRTGRSFSLHPSKDLLARFQVFSHSVRIMGEGTFIDGEGTPKRSSTSVNAVIPSPAILERRLNLPQGVRLLVHADPTFLAMNTLKRQFEMILGVPIQSKALSIDRLRSEIVQNSERSSSSYDIIACDLPWFGDMVVEGRLRELDDLIAQSGMDLADFLPDALASARRRGRQYGIPLLSTAELLVYRTDLLAEADIAPPRTTAQTLAAARALHAPQRGRYGIAWNGARGTAVGHTFMVTMATHGQPIVNLEPMADGFRPEDLTLEHLQPMFLSEAARAAADYLRELLEVSPPDILSMTWYDRARAFSGGQTALAYAHTLLADLFERDPASPAYRKTGYLPQPTGLTGRPISPLGGYALALPNNLAPDRVEPAWEAISALTSAGASKLYIVNGSLASPRFSVNQDPEVAAQSPLIGVVDDIARRGVLRAWPRPPVPGISAIIAIAGEEIHDLLSGAKSRDVALADAQRRAEAAIRNLGPY